MNKALTTIPLSKLHRAKDNVRKTEPSVDIDALAALIDAQGLLQNLVVRPVIGNGSKGQYEVLAGGRRLQALKLLAKRKRIAKDFPVPCKLLEAKRTTGVEVSLAENIGQAPLHPADQFEAFSQLSAQGLGVAEIAARCGITQKVVEQRLKLAAVSPRLMAVYKDGGMILEQLTAFTISDDHRAQEHLWFDVPLFDRSPGGIRAALTRALVEGTDRRARFVGIEAYEAAGGSVLRDLFAEDAAYFADSQLLDRLTAEKLAAETETVQTEGWSWVEVRSELDYEELARFGRVQPIEVKLPKKEQKKLQALSDRYDALAAQLEEEPNEAATAELDRLAEEIESRSQPAQKWSKEDKASAGAILSLDFNGRLTVTRGLVREENRRSNRRDKADGRSDERSEAVHSDHSDALLRDLSAHRTAALRESLAAQPDIALTALIHTLVLRTFFGVHVETCIGVRPVVVDLAPFADGIGESPAVAALADRHVRWGQLLPQAELVWSWLAEMPVATRLELLAYLVACTVNATWQRHGNDQNERRAQADRLAQAVMLDMSRWWQVTRKTYLDRMSKQQIVQAVTEAVSPQAAANISRMKKTAMAATAEELIAATRWLPVPLRTDRNAATISRE